MPADSLMILLFGMGLAAYACRALGFMAMRFIPLNPKLDAALRATPLGVMTGIITLAALNGGLKEWIAAGTAMGVMALTGKDMIASLAGIIVLALMRALF